MADERRPHPAPVPADADDFEAELAGRWRALAPADDDGPSELADARILRAARESNMTVESARPAWLRWSAAAALLAAVGTSLLLWRPSPVDFAPSERTEAGARELRIAADSAPSSNPAPASAAPIVTERREGAVRERRMQEDVATEALQQSRPVAAAAPPPSMTGAASDESAVQAVAEEVSGITSELAIAAARSASTVVTGRLYQRGERWFIAVEQIARFDDARALSDADAAAAPPAKLADVGFEDLELDLGDLEEDARQTLEADAGVRLRYVPDGSIARVVEIEMLPD